MHVRQGWLGVVLCGVPLVVVACGGDADDKGAGLGSGARAGKGSGGSGGTSMVPTTGGTTTVPTTGGTSGSGAKGGSGSGATGAGGSAGAAMCAANRYEQNTSSALDIYFVFDRTGSMGTDCAYQAGSQPPVSSKACFATYAMSDYLINVSASVDTRLAFQFMSQPDDCDGKPYETPLVPLTQLPVPSNHMLIQAISDETFKGGLGTHIEGALRGISAYTTAHQTMGREMIGVLMTDGDPSGCEEDVDALAGIVADHLKKDGLRTFIIGMEGATDRNLEQLAVAGGADPHADWCGSVNAPCHYWNVGSGDGDALKSALTAIVQQAAPIPCEFSVSGLKPPAGQSVDFGKVNVTLTSAQGAATTIGQVADKAACPQDVPAWYYDNPTTPTAIELCQASCAMVTDAASGSRVDVVVGCEDTMVLPPVK